MDWIRLRWEKPTDKGIRYYEVHLHQDLLGDWVLTCVWGRRGTALGRVQDQLCESYEEGLSRLCDTKKRRGQRGYAAIKEDSTRVKEWLAKAKSN